MHISTRLTLTGRLPDDGLFGAPGRTANSGDRGDGLVGNPDCPDPSLADSGRDEPAGALVPP